MTTVCNDDHYVKGWRNQLSVRTRSFFQFTCPWTSEKSYLCVCFQMIAIKLESLQTYYYFISEIPIIVKVLQNVKHESCS